ncbi:MAG: PEP-CTERM sorting domain-containing protein [Chthoniobacter sp.]|nr:PEP-CTERM sorting domain-containing protein [Chthoniobacter sp.]
MKILNLSIAITTLALTVCEAATISISIDSGAKSIRDDSNVPLSAGNLGTALDGTQVRLGYFSDGTNGAPFGTTGADAISTFVALTGPGTPFGINFTIGDSVGNSPGNGELFVDAFSISTGIADGLLPAAGTPLVLRFFNTAQTLVLDVSNTSGLWNWATPQVVPPSKNLSLDDVGTVIRGSGLNNRGTVAIASSPQTLNPTAAPEPTSAALLMVGLTSLVARRRRSVK